MHIRLLNAMYEDNRSLHWEGRIPHDCRSSSRFELQVARFLRVVQETALRHMTRSGERFTEMLTLRSRERHLNELMTVEFGGQGFEVFVLYGSANLMRRLGIIDYARPLSTPRLLPSSGPGTANRPQGHS